MADVDIQPAELKFRFAPNKQLLATITITNRTDSRVAFKIKTTAPRKYVVRPSSGEIEARTPQTINVVMQAQKEYNPADLQGLRDKFMVQTIVLGPNEKVDKDTFSRDTHPDMKEARLRVIMEAPPAPPSPVPEVNESMEHSDHMPSAGVVAGAQHDTITTSARTGGRDDAAALRAQVESLTKECDQLRRKLDYIELQGGSSTSATAKKPAGDAAMQFKVTLVHIILAAIVAFLVGHYT